MGSINSIDVKFADYLRRFFQYYIKKRTTSNTTVSKDEIWEKLFQNSNHFIYNLEDEIKIELNKNSVLSKLIYFGFENTEVMFLKKFLKPNDTFIDIGSNIGLFSLIASTIIKEKGHIYSFEPTPETFNNLNANIKLNHIKNISTYNIGLSNNQGVLEFNVSMNGHDAWNSFAKLNELKDANTIKVNVDTLDNFITNNQINKIDLIKLDVEGWEKFVLEGATKLLSMPNSPTLLVEFTEENTFAAGYYCGEIYDYLKSFGYEWYKYDILNNKLLRQSKQLHYPYDNLIAVKNIENCNNRLLNKIE